MIRRLPNQSNRTLPKFSRRLITHPRLLRRALLLHPITILNAHSLILMSVTVNRTNIRRDLSLTIRPLIFHTRTDVSMAYRFDLLPHV